MNAADESADAKARKAAAAALQQQIDDLVAGRTPPAAHPSFRDFVEQKMAEDRKNTESSPGAGKESASSGQSPDAKTPSAKDRGPPR